MPQSPVRFKISIVIDQHTSSDAWQIKSRESNHGNPKVKDGSLSHAVSYVARVSTSWLPILLTWFNLKSKHG